MKLAKIYKIINSVTDDVYVGWTTQPLYKRLYLHKCDMSKGKEGKLYNLMREFGVDKFRIELLEEYPHTSPEQARAKELEYRRRIGTLNTALPTPSPKPSSETNASLSEAVRGIRECLCRLEEQLGCRS